MRIDETHRGWLWFTTIALALAVAAYIPYSLRGHVSGGSWMGLTYGISGFTLMIFAGLLSLRKQFPIWRIGRAATWMRGHLWLGVLSFPLVLLHGGFHFGGALTRVLMWMFVVVFVSGILGAVLQHYLPRVQTERLPMETIYEQIDRVRGQLAQEAWKIVEQAQAALEGDVTLASQQQRAVAASAGANWDVTVASGLAADEKVGVELMQFYRGQVAPYLEKAGAHRQSLADGGRAAAMFRQMRILLPPGLHTTIDDLENICEEKRQLDQQSRMHRLLHGWLLVHIPLSYAVLLLGSVHAVMALRY
ncbi:MAG: hypothetical protein ACRD3Q_18400 [Terriglobales bacterium]